MRSLLEKSHLACALFFYGNAAFDMIQARLGDLVDVLGVQFDQDVIALQSACDHARRARSPERVQDDPRAVVIMAAVRPAQRH